MPNSSFSERRPNRCETGAREGSGESIVGVIPARGGSKLVPHKNIVSVAGGPLIEWTIEAARATEILTLVVVTTDSPRIAEVSTRYGAGTPF